MALLLALPLLLSKVNADEPELIDLRPHLLDNMLDVIESIPEIKNGAYYSFIDHGVNYSSQIAIIEKGGFSLNAGVAGDRDSTGWKAVTSISYDFGRLKDHGFNVPIIKYIGFEPYIVAGIGNIDMKNLKDAGFDVGFGASIWKAKF